MPHINMWRQRVVAELKLSGQSTPDLEITNTA
uniref:Uncharacterized protein n=1 Tax=Lepeophtheirus salmonis TaxID=72036 RepID=A0A0K2UHT0_LEPSM